MLNYLISLVETRLGWKCGCLCKRCIPGPHYFHCGAKITGCFLRPM